MPQNIDRKPQKSGPYSAVMTREQFLFHETRITAKLLDEGLERDEIIARILAENLFQYPTEKSERRMVITCLQRLAALSDPSLVTAIATEPVDAAKQICLYAMMRQYRLVWDFMLTVIGEKYRQLDPSFSRKDPHMFLLRLQEQDDWVAAWSDQTIVKLRQVLTRILVENGYLDSIRAERLNPVLISPVLERAMRASGREIALPAFNCLR